MLKRTLWCYQVQVRIHLFYTKNTNFLLSHSKTDNGVDCFINRSRDLSDPTNNQTYNKNNLAIATTIDALE